MLILKVTALTCLAALSAYCYPGQFQGSAIRWVDCSQNIPDDLIGLNITTIPHNLHCGEIDVPMNYDKPFCATNMITVGIAMCRPVKPKGVIFFNGGGSDPNVEVAWMVSLNLTTAFSGLEDFDLMMMDVRGTYSSNKLNITSKGLKAAQALLGKYPTDQSEFDAIKIESAIFIQEMIDSSTPPGIVEYLGTKEVVQDYEEIRMALGYDKINFLGQSYGSYRAQQYAATFPCRVDRFVLDSVIPHGLSPLDQALDQIAALNRIVLRADAYCQANASCPFHAAGKGSIPKAFSQILLAARKSPLNASECSVTPCNLSVTASDVQQMMFAYISAQPDFPLIFEVLEAALAGDASGFTFPTLVPLEQVVAVPLECGDFGYQELGYEDFKESLLAGSQADTSGILRTGTWQLQLSCSSWPYVSPGASAPLPVTDKSMLLVTADFDPGAPTEWTTFAWNQAVKSVLVVRHGDDHTSFALVDQPSTLITKDYLRTGVLPSSLNATLVTVYVPGMQRGPIPDPYSVPSGSEAGDIDSGGIPADLDFFR